MDRKIIVLDDWGGDEYAGVRTYLSAWYVMLVQSEHYRWELSSQGAVSSFCMCTSLVRTRLFNVSQRCV